MQSFVLTGKVPFTAQYKHGNPLVSWSAANKKRTAYFYNLFIEIPYTMRTVNEE